MFTPLSKDDCLKIAYPCGSQTEWVRSLRTLRAMGVSFVLIFRTPSTTPVKWRSSKARAG